MLSRYSLVLCRMLGLSGSTDLGQLEASSLWFLYVFSQIIPMRPVRQMLSSVVNRKAKSRSYDLGFEENGERCE